MFDGEHPSILPPSCQLKKYQDFSRVINWSTGRVIRFLNSHGSNKSVQGVGSGRIRRIEISQESCKIESGQPDPA